MSESRASNATDMFVPVIQSSARTRIKVWKSCYRWVIENFSYCPRGTGQPLDSPTFAVGPNSEQKWRLELYPNGVAEEYKDYISIYLKLVYSTESRTHAKFEISLLSDAGKKMISMTSSGLFAPYGSRGFKDFSKRDILLKNNTDFKITVHCELSASIETRSCAGIDEIRLTVPRFYLPEKMLSLLESGAFSDVVLNTGKEEFRVHAAILAANSSKFFTMFRNKVHSEPVQVTMKGYEVEVVSDLLEFMYAGRIPSFADCKADKLLAASNEFGLEELKIMVEDVLVTRVKVSNVGQLLLLADKNCARRLKEFCMDFIQTHVAAVLDTEAWKVAVKERPHLVDEVATTLAITLSSTS